MRFVRAAAEQAVDQLMSLYAAKWRELISPYLGDADIVQHQDLAIAAFMALGDGFCEPITDDLPLLSGMFTNIGRKFAMDADDVSSHPLLGPWIKRSFFDCVAGLVQLGATYGLAIPNPPLYHDLVLIARRGVLVNVKLTATLAALPRGSVEAVYLFGTPPDSDFEITTRTFPARVFLDLGELAYAVSQPNSEDKTVYGANIDPSGLLLNGAPAGVSLQ